MPAIMIQRRPAFRPAVALISTLSLLLAAASAGAQDQVTTYGHTPPDDEITLELSAESYVETATAKVVVEFDAALDSSNIGDQRAKLRQILTNLDSQAQWRFTRFDRSVDAAGLERWRVSAFARLAEKSLSGLSDRARQASKPGLQVKIAGIDFSPTLAEREAAYATLRSELYAQIQTEIEHLKTSFPGRPFRVKQVNFRPSDMPLPRPGAMAIMSERKLMPEEASQPEPAETAQTVARRIELDATVVLGAKDKP
jgi:hypothetical protein